ncbi:GDP-mannose 4,6-dehydratase [Paenibacillus sp. Soil724D2]|uniref:GDP-mannose 4,6-dehydratase n=1 Tax=Paenibacillus sp. (strain Soil724D2) TaxID=1736392 RepID=UPI0007145B54|nr:GDP-mannose 4,6-dehydratase [Paenibacillus sp. Soil724D2]KRE51060.1 hypothetical protein ASG85_19070 [Paenibacillus sp. Soil724D2]
MRALITGVTGFVGKHLSAYLINQGYKVWGITRKSSPTSVYINGINLVSVDLDKEAEMTDLIDLIKPDYIFHLAGWSSVRLSWANAHSTFESNVLNTICLLEAIRKSTVSKLVKVLTVGSSEEYGQVDTTEMPINENSNLKPISPYGISKATVSMLAKQYFDAYNLQIIHVRPFNHIGPGQGEGFVTSDFAKQIVQIENGQISPNISVGNLESERDFTDVRDIVASYELLLRIGEIGKIYNVCSGRPVPIKVILKKFIELSSCKEIKTIEDPNKMRLSDFPCYIGDPTKIKTRTNWTNSIRLDQSLLDILNYWRKELSISKEPFL